jgi:hypothetical protein
MACFIFSARNAIRATSGTWCQRGSEQRPAPTCSPGGMHFGSLAAMNLEQISVDYVVVDTIRVPRQTFAAIIEAWRDGYSESIGELTPITRESAVAYFNQMIANIRDPLGYGVWMVPVVSARVGAA